MRRIKKILLGITAAVMIGLASISLTSCRTADMVEHNIKKDADYFKTYRRMTFINLYSDKMLYQVEGYFSLRTTMKGEMVGQQEIAIVIMVAPDEYQMNYFSVANNVTYVIEQIENTHTNPYHWEIKWFIPIPEIK